MQRVEILQKFQNKYLRIIVNAPWYVNDTLDFNVSYVRDKIKRIQRYADSMEEHANILAINLMKEVKTARRLKRKLRQDLCT